MSKENIQVPKVNGLQVKAKYTDETVITFGVHKGKKLANVPADYLLFLHREGKCSAQLKEYIDDNMEVLKKEGKK